VCPSLEAHPARRLVDHGVKITVNSDDFTLFGAGVSDELLNLTQMGFNVDEIAQIVENGLMEMEMNSARPEGSLAPRE
jgi:aminodeoxyfutalosine deaminase